jgi:hypothetical protein
MEGKVEAAWSRRFGQVSWLGGVFVGTYAFFTWEGMESSCCSRVEYMEVGRGFGQWPPGMDGWVGIVFIDRGAMFLHHDSERWSRKAV